MSEDDKDIQTWGPDHSGEMIAVSNEDYVTLSDYKFVVKAKNEEIATLKARVAELEGLRYGGLGE